MELRNKNLKSRQDTYEKSLLVQVQLSQWINMVYDTTEQEPCDEDGAFGSPSQPAGDVKHMISSPHKMLLLIQQHESTISLNRPLLVSGPETPRGVFLHVMAVSFDFLIHREIILTLHHF